MISGIAMQTEFTVECTGWHDGDAAGSLTSDRLSYTLSQRGHASPDAFSQTGIFHFLIFKSGETNNNDILALQVLITGYYGDSATFHIDVQVVSCSTI